MENKNINIFINNFLDEVKRQGYNDGTVQKHRVECGKILSFAQEEQTESYSIELSKRYLDSKYPNAPNEQNVCDMPSARRLSLRTITHLNNFSILGRVDRYRQRCRFDGLPIETVLILDEFRIFCETSLSIANHIAEGHVSNAKHILAYLRDNNYTLNNVSELILVQFALSISKRYKNDTRDCIFYSIRIFCRFLHATKRCETDCSELIPHIKLPKNAKIPSVWEESEIKKLLSAIDTNTLQGKRDYAVLLLIARLGIREGDVKNLRIGDFDWDHHQLNFVQQKTETPISLPIPNDVGWAIIDYLRNGRPDYLKYGVHEDAHVFVTMRLPVKPYGINSRFNWLIKCYADIAGLDMSGHKHGAHSLRHTLATNLMNNKIPLPVISSVLGHTSPVAVQVYLKVDIEHLRDCAVNPMEVCNANPH